jgi:hypothetical protein
MHAKLRQDLAWIQQASYCTALIEQTTELETPLPEVYALLTSVLTHLAERPPNSRTLFAFELKMLELLGQQPDLIECRLAPGTRAIARVLSAADWESIGHLNLSEEQSMQLSEFLHGFLIYHLGKLPRGRADALGT